MIFVRVCSYGTLQAALAAVMTWFNKHEGPETYTDAAKAAAVASAAAAAVGQRLGEVWIQARGAVPQLAPT